MAPTMWTFGIQCLTARGLPPSDLPDAWLQKPSDSVSLDIYRSHIGLRYGGQHFTKMCPSCSSDSCDVASSSSSEGTVFYDTTPPPPLIVFSSGRNFNLSPTRAVVDSSYDADNDDSSHDAEIDDSRQDAETDDSNCDAEVEPANDIKGVYPYLNERQILHPETGLNHITISSMVMSIDPKPSMAAWSYLHNES